MSFQKLNKTILSFFSKVVLNIVLKLFSGVDLVVALEECELFLNLLSDDKET
jgi:hypothetical protein